MEQEIKVCCLCGKRFSGWGNNPWPLAEEGECCDDCNNDVIMARLRGLKAKEN